MESGKYLLNGVYCPKQIKIINLAIITIESDETQETVLRERQSALGSMRWNITLKWYSREFGEYALRVDLVHRLGFISN